MTTTPLDRHRHTNTSDPRADGIAATIADRGVEFIYYQVPTLTGRTVSKVVPAQHLTRNLEKGVQFHRTAMTDLHTDRTGQLLGGGVQAAELTAIPDLDTFAVMPWDTSVARFYCTAYEPDHIADIGGNYLALDTRAALHRAHAAFTEETGLVLKTGCEPEMTWYGPGMEVTVRPGGSTAYQTANLEVMRPIYKLVISYARALGLDMIEGDYEDPGQLELNWLYDDCTTTADRLITYRQICHQVARETGVKASFMPKPAQGSMGNGCHHNLSLWDGAENVMAEPGRRDLHLSKTGLHALGGILAHAAGSTAIMASTVNSYKRFWDDGQFAPTTANWGMDNKTCTVRLSAVGRLEYKIPDASVNPYLSHTALLAAIKDGIDNAIDPGDPQVGSSYDGKGLHARLPLTLGEAVTTLNDDPVIRGCLPAELVDQYTAVKFDEWARACGAVTDFDREMYLEYL
ncbi:glutamine synthetase family protein [Mycobacterium sp. 21AC1]|uniref:glutamine synthetase family protein n=1 Tax=[Mycobacterium] appelbergii TaxID=2939269 RepID=UPI002938FAF5|nr:glutamine synthetase family protein [Mycobacterium sp. 21AC1]MDV3130065.1 glutamine synthetase family protein [Mycobacterium sp. 21AC1]